MPQLPNTPYPYDAHPPNGGNDIHIDMSLTELTEKHLDAITDPYMTQILEVAQERGVTEPNLLTLYALLIARLARDSQPLALVNGTHQGVTVFSRIERL